MMEMIRSSPQLFRARQVVRGVHVEEQDLRVAVAGDLGQGEDTDADALMEGDGPEIAPVETLRDGVAAGGTVRGAQRLQAPAAVALRQEGVVRSEALAQAGAAVPRRRRACPRRRRTTGAGVSTTAV